MASTKTTRKRSHLQPVKSEPDPYAVAMRKLGLDWPTIDQIAEAYKPGTDEFLVLTIVLLQRLLNLAQMDDAPEPLDVYLPLLIDRLYRATSHCENAAGIFAANIDKELRASVGPRPTAERRAS